MKKELNMCKNLIKQRVSKTDLSKNCQRISKNSAITLIITAFCIMTFSIMAFSIMTFSII